MRTIYLDYNATTPMAPSAVQAMLPFLSEHFGNPSSNHALGRACQEAIEDARCKVAMLIGADPDEVFFTSGGTESNNLAIQGTMLLNAPPMDGHLIVSAIEHPAVSEPARHLQRMGFDVTTVGCDGQGRVPPEEVLAAIRPDTRLVSIMHANNETGVVQPLSEIAQICQDHEVPLHSDAAQTIGKIPTDVDELGVDMLTLAGHKLYAPKGVGALYIRRGIRIEPVLRGAGHESGLRPGTENVPYLVGLGHVAALASNQLDEAAGRMKRLRDQLHEQLSAAIGTKLQINGAAAARLPNTLSVRFPEVAGADLLARIPELCASTGSACHSGQVSMSPTLRAMGLTVAQARGTVRLSVGWYTTEDEVQRAANLLIGAWEALV